MSETWVELREPHTRKLLARYDPTRNLLEFVQRNVKTVIDLNEYKVVGSLFGMPVVTDPTIQPHEIRFGNLDAYIGIEAND